MTKILGIDESGRGPVIGSMVMCGVVIDESKERELVNIGVKDSKLLLPKVRELLYNKIEEIADEIFVIIVNPKEIDDALENPLLDLNKLEALKTAEIILKSKADIAFLDCPSVNIASYKSELQNLLGDSKIKLNLEHKADLNYPVVGAASIIAKVTRDRLIEEIKQKYNVDFGSGYPSDPKTITFLEKNWDNPKFSDIFRKSWDTWKRIKINKSQMKLGGW